MTGPIPRPDPGPAPDILLVEDTSSLRAIYEAHLRGLGQTVLSAATAAEGLALFGEYGASVVLLDLMLPDRDGIELLTDMLALRPGTAIVAITADRSIDRAVAAMRAGAQDFLVKPVNEARLMAAIENARHSAQRALPPDAAETRHPMGDFIGDSEPMQTVYTRIRSAARSMAPVFITGESGTGKEMCAQSIHALSPRASAPFITLDCGAIPSDRLESEVFGHLRGSFPGAVTDKPGAALLADGGTLFLDEIGGLDPGLQTKLLRFLQTAQIRPLGAAEPRKVNVRIISASSLPPLQAVREGRLREDLYYRLHVVPIHMPPLRARREDIPALAHAALRHYAILEARSFRAISPQAEAVLRAQDWPGNVRQLMNVLRSAIVMHDGTELSETMLPPDLSQVASAEMPAEQPGPGLQALAGRTLADIERIVIEDSLARQGGSVPRAARELGVAPSTLYRKIEGWKDA
ncbi:sigma-54 dependent transcriptional regulator [Paenirhodobacter sp. CAU 1674]|jgi:DNA-binding NtrC family response regulator|uniref:sigma-54-dependent transcriptional regulator n=1 Tax=Paenirhodobacter sp. CAU 1674 TaxID=3032596 RepID=UPI0023DAB11E|nr:sigma-54 dependent transcriptional regulator [Paenirhodobacter sp. CAU 1674]MDF2141506.1 sigma-54 dependent transcriptional regulator [Paenirhodobacter sp. CAU 1674]